MAIQQHPIPQNVPSYQFRLVGDMTLKQFFELAGGIIVGLIFYALGLPALFKWPLVGLSVGLGAGMAFLPVGGRTLDQWLLAFFRSIYQPTVFTWKKTAEPVSVITPTKTLQPTQLTKIVPAVAAPEAASVSFSASPQLASSVPVTPKPVLSSATAPQARPQIIVPTVATTPPKNAPPPKNARPPPPTPPQPPTNR